MSIGLNVLFRSGEQDYWPYLTQRHLTNFLWPLAGSLGLPRVELMEVLPSYRDADELGQLILELKAVQAAMERPKEGDEYEAIEHVRDRTAELIERLTEVASRSAEVAEVSFF